MATRKRAGTAKKKKAGSARKKPAGAARKKPAGAARKKKAAAVPREAVIDAALRLAALQGWRHTSLADIAGEAGLTLAEVGAEFTGKPEILAAFMARIDHAMLADPDPDLAREPVRDRLFDIIMRRLDALAPHKQAVAALARDLRRDPCAAACFAAGPMRRSLDWMLEGAGVTDWGPLQPLQRKGLGLIYLNTLRVWLDEEEGDQSRTMAALAKGLDRADRLVSTMIPGRRRPADQADTEAVV